MSAISYVIGLKNNAFLSGINGALGGVGKLGGAISGLAKLALPVGGLIGAGGALALLKKSSNIAAEFESTSVAFKTLIGDADKAKKVIGDIATLGEQTPFEFAELADAGRKLVAFNENSDQVVDTLRRLGDVAAGIQQPIGEIAELYGKARVQGTLFTEDINQMTGRGIPIIQELAKVMGVTDDQVKKLASDGKVTFPLLEQAFINLTLEGGKFFNMMAEQSTTTKGLLSTLTDGWNKLLRLAGEPLNDWLKPQITGWIENLDSAGVRFSALINLLKEAQSQGSLGDIIGTGLTLGAVKAVNVFAGGIRGSAAFLSEAIPGAFAVGLGVLFNSGIDRFLGSIFQAGGLAFESAVYRALSALPTFEGYADVAKIVEGSAASAMRIAGMELQDSIADMPSAIKTAAQEFKTLMVDASRAAKEANAAPLIDPTNAQNAFDQIAKGINLQSWQELISGETKRAETMQKTKTKADDLDKALNKLGDSAEKATAKTKSGKGLLDGIIGSEPAREMRKIFMKDLRDGPAGAVKVRPGANGLFEPVEDVPGKGRNPFGMNRLREDAAAIQNRGRNEFGKNRPQKEPDAKKDVLQDPIQKMAQLLESMDRRLANLGLAS
jgi:tape measure domain-containing protein